MSSSRKPESSIRTKIVAAMNARRGARARVLHSGPEGFGFLDVLVCYRGRFVYLEVKTQDPKSEPTPLQRHEMKKWSEVGAIVRCVRTVAGALAVLDLVDGQHECDEPELYSIGSFREDIESGMLLADEPRLETKGKKT